MKSYIIEFDNGERYEDNNHYPLLVYSNKGCAEQKIIELNRWFKEKIEVLDRLPLCEIKYWMATMNYPIGAPKEEFTYRDGNFSIIEVESF